MLKRYYYLIPAIIFAILYFQTIFYGSAWGDDPMVISAPARDFNLMLKSFYDPSQMLAHHYVPLFYVDSYLINLIFGENAYPFGFHLQQYVSQILVCILAALLMYELTKNKLLSVLIVLFWTLHPINVQFLTRLLVSFGVLSFNFILGYYLCFLHAAREELIKRKYFLIIFGSVLFLSGLLCVEWFFFAPLVLFSFLIYLYGAKLFNKKYLPLHLATALTYIIYFVLRSIGTHGVMLSSNNELLSWTEIGTAKDILFRLFWLSPQLIVHYLKLFFFPYGLIDSATEWYKVGNSLLSPYSLFCQMLVLFLIGAIFFCYKKLPLVSIGLIWFFLSFAFTIQAIPLFSIVALRYCYIPTVGLILALFGLVDYFQRYIPKQLLMILIGIVYIFFVSRTVYYLPSSKDLLTQYIYCAKEAPLWNRTGYYAKALDLAWEEKKDKELPKWLSESTFESTMNEWLDTYLDMKPGLAIKYGPMQMAYNFYVLRGVFKYLFLTGHNDKLEQAFNSALAVNDGWIGWFEIARFLREKEQWKPAWEALKNAIQSNPLLTHSYGVQFIEIAIRANKSNEANYILNNYIKLNPLSSYPYLVYGLFLNEIGERDKALQYFKEAIDEDKSISVGHDGLYDFAGNLFMKYNLYKEAKRSFEMILSFDPYNIKAKDKLKEIVAVYF
ncbi:MAG: hypothetical protein HYR97_07375 [Candidatus Melainabacteria bacterium]|nr:hypothetical protein [Candidatus Melainabacteria bacterium]